MSRESMKPVCCP